MRAYRCWFLFVVLAACSDEGSPPSPPDGCNGGVSSFLLCGGSGGTPYPVLSSDRQAVEFGSIAVSTTTPVTAIQISNTGSATTGAITPITTGMNAAEFTVTNGCSTLAPMGTCTVTVSFKPASAGAKVAELIVSSSPGGTVMIALSGTGMN